MAIGNDRHHFMTKYLVDPTRITNYERTDEELQTFLLFCIAVAGKTASVISKKIQDFLYLSRNDFLPFDKIKEMVQNHSLGINLQRVKLGKYSILGPCYSQISQSCLDLRTCSTDDLEKFPGIGPKTSRFFILHSRKDQEYACLDTHVLQYLKNLGHKVPKSSPSGNKYKELEQIFLLRAKELKRLPADLDLDIWNTYSKKSGNKELIKYSI